MGKHAFLSPSASNRWLHCTASPHLEKLFPAVDTVYTKEGTEAHKIAAELATAAFTGKSYKPSVDCDAEMLQMAELYVGHLTAHMNSMSLPLGVVFETEVDLSDYVPESFGSCDCALFGWGKLGNPVLVVTDYKYGRGVLVKAEDNSQLMLYALGLDSMLLKNYGFQADYVIMCIDQPRLNSYDTFVMSRKDLIEWGNSIKSIAQEAFTGPGICNTGEWCRFCRARGQCKSLAESYISTLQPFLEKSLLRPDQQAVVLELGENLVNWYNSVKESALNTILQGTKVPGWKAVASRGRRAWTNEKEAIQKLIASGIARETVYSEAPKTLAQIEKQLGKKTFSELVGEYVAQKQGTPALVRESDKRAEYNSAVTDFQDVVND